MILEFPLIGTLGFELRQRASNFLGRYATTTGAERGSLSEQGSGLLAEIVVRHILGLPKIEDDTDRNTNLGYDILLPTGVKVDVKCRGGVRPFTEFYPGSGGLNREAKHNLFARQVFATNLDTDIYLMTHLRVADKGELPGTSRQRNWCLYICGWVSKKRVRREGVYLERGSLTEQGNTWFTYRGQEIEFYQKNLNQIDNATNILNLSIDDVANDEGRIGHYNLTSVDAIRIALDLFARGLLTSANVDYIKSDAGITIDVDPILNNNQYLHLAEWLFTKNQITELELDTIKQKFVFIPFTGI